MLKKLRNAERGAGPEFCPTCENRRAIVEVAGPWARARRCPDCSDRCRSCNGTGWVISEDELGNLHSRKCDCESTDLRIRLFNRAGVPGRYASATLETVEERNNDTIRRAKVQLLRMVRDDREGQPGLGLSGPVGTGKTHMMCAYARALALERGTACRFIEFTHLLSTIRAGYDKGQSESQTLGYLVRVPVLIIDEVGKGLSTEWQINILDELISKRYNRNVTTCFTTNYPYESKQAGSVGARRRAGYDAVSLEERIGARMFSRLTELTTLMTLDAPDFRKEKARR